MKYEIFCRYKNQAWEHCDYAKDKTELNYLISEYRMAYGVGFSFKYKRI